jgi:hypothetical protein
MDQLDSPISGRPLTNDLGERIGSMLAEGLFGSCKVLCYHFLIGKTMGLRILHDKLGLNNLHFRWVAEVLLIDQGSEKVPHSTPFLMVPTERI